MTIDQQAIDSKYLFFRGRVALAAILRALGVGREDRVALQAFTCSAVPEAILAVGARPQWVDVASGELNMNAATLAERITHRTRAIVVQHTFGLPAAMPDIVELADSFGIPVIEDCCHTIASSVAGQSVGAFGVAAFYSFEWGKPVPLGIGGGVRVNTASLRAALARIHGQMVEPGWLTDVQLTVQYGFFTLLRNPFLYWPVRTAFHALTSMRLASGNYSDLTDSALSSDFGLRMASSVRRRFSRWCTARPGVSEHAADLVRMYEELSLGPNVRRVCGPANAEVAYVRYPLLVLDKLRLLKMARARNLEMASWYSTPVHPLRGSGLEAVSYDLGACPRAESRCDQVVSLPVHDGVTRRYVRGVARLIGNGK